LAQLDSTQKMSIKEQLNQILVDLRSVTLPDGMCLGGVAGEGCKDAKRHLRRSTTIRQSTIPIVSVKDFECFQFPQPSFPGHVFADFLHQFSPLRQSSLPVQCRCVFTHGDIRPDNIAVLCKSVMMVTIRLLVYSTGNTAASTPNIMNPSK
jgi:hypothetical protein